MTEKTISASEVGRHADIIRAAQEEIRTMDLFVCGRCNEVFHFPEEFQSHKEDNECEDSPLINLVTEKPPHSFGYLLWKHSRFQKSKDAASQNQYKLYEEWFLLEAAIRNSWKAAGQIIFSHGRVALSVIEEVNVKIEKSLDKKVAPAPVVPKKIENSTPKSIPAPPKVTEKCGSASKTEVKQPLSGQSQRPLSRLAKRTSPATNIVSEERVEKILAKRFSRENCRQEYLVKWEGLAGVQNTWESVENLRSVQYLVDYFERQLARQKQTRAIQQAKCGVTLDSTSELRDRKVILNKKVQAMKTDTVALTASSPISRPTRTSKTKAMDQVKQWVQDNSKTVMSNTPMSGDEEEEDFNENQSPPQKTFLGPKRKADEMADLSLSGKDLEEDLIPSHMVKRKKNDSPQLETKAVTSKPEENKNIKTNGSNIGLEISIKLPPNSASVEIKKNSQESGIIRKPNATVSKSNNLTKAHAKVRIISKDDSLTLATGIMRASDSETLSIKRVIQKDVLLKKGSQVPADSVSNPPLRQHALNSRPQGGNQHHNLPSGSSATAHLQPQLRHDIKETPRNIISSTTTTVADRQMSSSDQIMAHLPKSSDSKLPIRFRGGVQDNEVNNIITQQKQSNRSANSPISRTQGVGNLKQTTYVQNEVSSDEVHIKEDVDEADLQLCPITGQLTGDQPGQADVYDQLTEMSQDGEVITQNINIEENSEYLSNEDGSPMFIRSEDGTLYQVAGKDPEGQTVLVCRGPDGEEQYAYMAAADENESQNLAIANPSVEHEEQANDIKVDISSGQYFMETAEGDQSHDQANLQVEQQLDGSTVNFEDGPHLVIQQEGEESGVTAQVLQAGLPSPGGTRRVVLVLPDGQYIVTEIHEDELKPLGV